MSNDDDYRRAVRDRHGVWWHIKNVMTLAEHIEATSIAHAMWEGWMIERQTKEMQAAWHARRNGDGW